MQKVNIPLIAGLVSGLVFVNAVLAFTWFMCRRSNRRKSQLRQLELAAKHDLEKSASFFKKNTEVAAPVDVETPADPAHDDDKDEDEEEDTEDELTQSEKGTDRYTPYPKQRRQSQQPSIPAPPPGLTAPPPPRDQLTVPSSFKHAQQPGTSAAASLCETESMYSTASAPIHLHEQILLSPPPALRNPNNLKNERLITTPRPVAGRFSYRDAAASRGPLPSPIRPLLTASPIQEAFGEVESAQDVRDQQQHHLGLGAPPPRLNQRELTPRTLPRSPFRRLSTPAKDRPASEWYYTPKRNSVTGNLPQHIRPALVEPLRVVNKSTPIGRQQAFKHHSMQPSSSSSSSS